MRLAVCVISSGRPGNVARVQQQFPSCSWYIPDGQAGAYLSAGAREVHVVTGTLPMKSRQLNRALEQNFNGQRPADVVATVDDDIVKCILASNRKAVPLMTVVADLADRLLQSDYRLAGPYSGTNTRWAGGEDKNSGLIPGAMMVHLKSELRFDEQLKNLVDLDYCMAHHLRHGGVLMAGDYCLQNEFQDNPGGLVDHRNPELIKECVEYLSAKWGDYGCKFEEAPHKKNKIKWVIRWQRLAAA
jgi:hypothetical protein